MHSFGVVELQIHLHRFIEFGRVIAFEEKQEALSVLGSNITLKDKKLNVINAEIFSVIQKGLLEAKSKNRAFEPKKYQANKGETEVFASVIPALLPRLHIYRTV